MPERYAKDVLVDTAWVEKHLDDPGVRVVEVDEDPTQYIAGHIPGAVAWNWGRDLADPTRRDFVAGARMEALLGRSGIATDTTVVLYGDRNNWFATYAYWLLTLRGAPHLRVLDGGRHRWALEGLPLVRDGPGVRAVDHRLGQAQPRVRAFRADVEALLHTPTRAALVDVRSPQEYTGELIAMPAYPQEGASRGGHIPGAVNLPWSQNVAEDGTFRPAEELRRLYESHGVTPDKDVVAYCRIGERASLTWFTLHELLGYPRVRNYDGSWTEWGNLVAAPIVKGPTP